MEQKLIKAPIDQKNIVSDWIDEIFDDYWCLHSKNRYVGFINDIPASCQVDDNMVDWNLHREDDPSKLKSAFLVLKERLQQLDDADNDDLVIKTIEYGFGEDAPLTGITQYFYFIVE